MLWRTFASRTWGPRRKLDRLGRRAPIIRGGANERVPYRMLDAAWTRHIALDVTELDHPAIPLSPLGAGVDLLEASTEDAYAFTHALPYATDFGRIPLPKNSTGHLLGTAEAVVVKALDEDDLDLLAEVLMAPSILRLDGRRSTFCWNVLERVWNEFGFVPGPGIPPSVNNETRTQTIRRVLGTTYHTSFAAGLCCATLVACGPASGGKGRSNRQYEGAARKRSMWRIDWNRSPGSAREPEFPQPRVLITACD